MPCKWLLCVIHHKAVNSSICMQSHRKFLIYSANILFAEYATPLRRQKSNIPTPLYRKLLGSGTWRSLWCAERPQPYIKHKTISRLNSRCVFHSLGWQISYSRQEATTDEFKIQIYVKSGHHQFWLEKSDGMHPIIDHEGRHLSFRYCIAWYRPSMEYAQYSFLSPPLHLMDWLMWQIVSIVCTTEMSFHFTRQIFQSQVYVVHGSTISFYECFVDEICFKPTPVLFPWSFPFL